MMLSQKSKYALKALLVLSQEYDKGPVQVSEIATREKIPHRFLELILLKLKNHGVLLEPEGERWRLLPQQTAGSHIGWTCVAHARRTLGSAALRQQDCISKVRGMR
jgi:hypothetical protein